MEADVKAREIRLGEKQERSFTLERAAVDEETRTAVLSYASEEPVERFYRGEIVEEVIDIESSDYNRMENGAPLLINHDPDQQIGVVEKSWVSKNSSGVPVARAKVRFSKSARGEEIWQDVREGIRGNTSVGYEPVKVISREEREGQPPVLRFGVNFLEASLVAVPADNSVGVGRSQEPVETKEKPENRNMSEETKETAQATETATLKPEVKIVNEPTPEQKRKFQEDAVTRERKRMAGIDKAAEQLKDYEGITPIAQEAKRDGWSLEKTNEAMLEAIGNGTVETRDFGLSKKEKESYSFQRAFQCQLHGKPVDGLEGEVSREFGERMGGKDPSGFWVPLNLGLGKVRANPTHFERTVLTTAADANGEDLYPNVHRGDLFVEALRPALFMESVGARILNITTPGAISIPKFTSTSALTWQSEETGTTESEPETATIDLVPNEGSTYTQFSKRLMAHSDPGVEQLIREELTQTVGVGLDTAWYTGSGTNQPTGVENLSSIGTFTVVSSGSPTRTELVAAEADIDNANALFGESLYWVTDPGAKSNMRATQEASNMNSWLWSNDNTILGYPAVSTSLATDNEIVFGNFAQYIGVTFGGVDLMLDPYSNATNRVVRVHVNVMADGNARHDTAFTLGD